MQAGSAIAWVLACVDESAYTGRPDGSRLPQTSAPTVIARMLELLRAERGHRVLEIGTGSGFSTAVLSRLCGHVTSIDVDPELTGRAARLLAADGRLNVTPVTGDGLDGVPGARFDRVIAWVTPDLIPDAWDRQAAPGAVIVSPVNLAPLACSKAVVRAVRGPTSGELTPDVLVALSFVDAHRGPVDRWDVPFYGVDTLIRDQNGGAWWLSSEWLRTDGSSAGTGRELVAAGGTRPFRGGPAAGVRLLALLIAEGGAAPSPLASGERAADFQAFLMATRPDGLTTGAMGDHRCRFGCSDPTGAALLSSDGDLFHAGSPDVATRLAAWAGRWRGQGRPGLADLTPVLHRRDSGWDVRATAR